MIRYHNLDLRATFGKGKASIEKIWWEDTISHSECMEKEFKKMQYFGMLLKKRVR